MPATDPPRRAVVALGGNAIAPAGTAGTAEEQTATISAAMARVADLIAEGLQVVLTHGNGPQVGNLLVKNELARHEVPPVPLDWCVAQTQATIGFTMATALEAELAARQRPGPVVPVVSRTRVDRDDPAWQQPTKPIGRYASEAEARERAERTGQTWVRQGDKGWRRVVCSPEPRELLDAEAVRRLLDVGAIVVCYGGGGVPMVRKEGRLRGAEAVIDKDLTAALLSAEVAADVLCVLTDVPGAATDHGTDAERWLDHTDADELARLQQQGHFAAGSMAPKVEAVRRFAATTGGRGAVGSLEAIVDVAHGTAGTQVHPGGAR